MFFFRYVYLNSTPKNAEMTKIRLLTFEIFVGGGVAVADRALVP